MISVKSVALTLLLASFCCLPSAFADEGNGVGSAYVEHTPARIGGVIQIDFGSPGLAGAQALFIISDGLGLTTFPGIGPICLDVFSPAARIAVDTFLDANGNASRTVGIPNMPSLSTFDPIYALSLVVDFTQPTFFSLSKTVAIYFENGDGYMATGVMGEARSLHTATAFNGSDRDQNVKVFVAGGGAGNVLGPTASDTTEIYSPLTRSFSAGPAMSVVRVFHQSVRLDDGRILVTGGFDNMGAGHDNCEIFDPASGVFSATGALNTGRGAHLATKLPNGNVLVTGGLPSFAGGLGTSMLAALLNQTLDTAEVYDVVTGTWSATANNMSAPRFGHAQVLLGNGDVLVTGGIDGAVTIPFAGVDVPTFTATCDLYVSATNSFVATASLPQAVAAHGLSVLGNGDVLATGGLVSLSLFLPPGMTADCNAFDGVNWNSTAPLATPVALHTQVSADGNGDALVHGGIAGSLLAPVPVDAAGRHDGTAFSSLGLIGLDPGVPAQPSFLISTHTMTRVYEGSYLMLGGADASVALDTGYVYLEG
ncbi:MAG: kelch repeat-containing protein [Planctomycetota bacterium]